MEAASLFIGDPSLRGAGRRETGEVCDQQRAARFQHPRHLADRHSEVSDIDKCEIADDQIETCRLEFKLLSAAEPIIAGWMAPPCGLEKSMSRVDPDRRYAGCLEHSAKATFAATNVQGPPEAACRDPAEHYWIEHVLSRPISSLANGVDPGLR